MQPRNSHVYDKKNEISTSSAQPFRATGIKVTLITRPMLMSFAQKLCRCEPAELNVHYRTAVSTETVVHQAFGIGLTFHLPVCTPYASLP
jgi:hypothetical protein